MDLLRRYLEQSAGIIGERTPKEVKYDREVIRWLRKGKPIGNAISKANQKYPEEALQVTDDNLADVQAHYEYVKEHEDIVRKLKKLR